MAVVDIILAAVAGEVADLAMMTDIPPMRRLALPMSRFLVAAGRVRRARGAQQAQGFVAF